MRIAIVSREYPPFFGGGIGAYTVRWSRALAAAGHSVIVITISDDGTRRREQRDGLTVVRLPFIQGQDWSKPHPAIATAEARAAFATFSPVSVFSMQIASELSRLHHEFEFDVVEFPDTGALGWFTLNDRRTGRLWTHGGPAVVCTIHSPSEWIAEWNRSPLRGRRDHELAAMEEDCIRWSDAVVCPSRAVASWARDRYGLPASAIEVIPYPLGDLEPIARAAARSQVASRPVRRLAFAGRLEPRKGVDTLIEGFRIAVEAGADLSLDLIGEDMPDPDGGGGFGARRLEPLPDAVRSRIRAHGKVPPARVTELQAAADGAVVPAPMDNFPFTCVEAMAHGRLAIAANSGGMSEMIRPGRDGLLFDAGDAHACAAALRTAAAMEPSIVREMGKSAAGRILDVCGNDGVVAARIGHFKRAIDGRARPSSRPNIEAVIVNGAGAPAGAIERLRAALATSGASFAHGWIREPSGRLHARSTPRIGLLALGSRKLGPLAVERSWAERGDVRPLLRSPAPGNAEAESTWAIAVTLLALGGDGVVVPDVISACAADQPPSSERVAQLEAELTQIRSSRGWRVLQRVYDLLHIARGRGLRRP